MIPPCISYAIENGPASDDSMGWAIGLAKWLKKDGRPLETAPIQIARYLNASDSMEDLGDEEILAFCKTAYASDFDCNELMACPSFGAGCTKEACPEYNPPVVPLVEGEPTACRITWGDDPGSVGVDEDGKVKRSKAVSSRDGSTKMILEFVSDCAVYIHTETIADEAREFVFAGTGAVNKKQVRFTMPAEDLADVKKFKAALINAFGAANRVGTLTFEIVQQISKNTITRRRLCAPAWVENMPMVPGVGLAEDIEFKLLPMIPASVHDGDLDEAKACLGKLLDVPGPTKILVTAILGSPIYARWFLNDRFGVGMWGTTGSLKTSITKKAMCIYGIGYNDDANLLKHGKSGSTAVGELEICAGAGILPQIIDNVKSVDPRDAQQYIATIHAVIEGKDKVRGKKDGGIRNSKPFFCTPIVTGEIKPDEASTSARILNLKWTEPKSKDEVDYVQANVAKLPVIGYHWLRYISTIDFDIRDGFERKRSEKTETFNALNYVNSGRLATIYSLLRATWFLLEKSPFGEIFADRRERFIQDLDAACDSQGSMVSEETEVSKFIRGVQAILSTQPQLIQQHENQMADEMRTRDIIGRWIDGDLFLVPAPTLAALKRLGVFTQVPTEGSITDALDQAGYIKTDGKRRKVQQRMNSQRPYGWLISSEMLNPKDASEDAKTDNKRQDVFKTSLS